ncbi:DUF4376 domain-containing protein [Salmonella enterica subsp. enterica]|uniref:DUF4376 domain-containing protein n=1 Tax=Salmonella enterica TaxID=28901 RepID=UPI00126CF2D2|nr:DUF4376 domain-containing protein [Salmonella enterica]ECH8733998.1 DUF4376 domain-containing protein [Salmonella enterica subsp. enterica serovar Wandsworth]EDT6629434.1 DUF4376 domain-containing protein [Salmonella enterica subsp. enterica serovar Wandsworth]EDT6698767.1 DUF4376 domain-containing protein [Salmonella enterica subsp. enterica serovar Wandsworth]EDT6702817.1 DUF4376 domain-containing protein [Salmonella enterica subsp. enterica serovar Wandsworth]EDT6712496.1 DUF4376 domain-
MQNIKHFTPYEPESPTFPGAAYLKSEDGQDWYECQALFTDNTLKFTYDDNGVITCITRDVSGLWPYNLSVAEVPDTDENRRADISGRWGFDGENIIDLMTREDARSRKHDDINRWRNVQESANYTFTFDNHKWDYGKATQERLTLSVQMAKANKLPAGFIWTDADNNDVPMTAGELLNLSDAIDQAMFTKGLQIHMRQREMKEEIDGMTDVKAILDYVVGWPNIPTK